MYSKVEQEAAYPRSLLTRTAPWSVPLSRIYGTGLVRASRTRRRRHFFARRPRAVSNGGPIFLFLHLTSPRRSLAIGALIVPSRKSHAPTGSPRGPKSASPGCTAGPISFGRHLPLLGYLPSKLAFWRHGAGWRVTDTPRRAIPVGPVAKSAGPAFIRLKMTQDFLAPALLKIRRHAGFLPHLRDGSWALSALRCSPGPIFFGRPIRLTIRQEIRGILTLQTPFPNSALSLVRNTAGPIFCDAALAALYERPRVSAPNHTRIA
jgi:hypothetical protein